MEGFTEELEAFKERVRGRAKVRIERAIKEYEEEEQQKRLGPGGLDPVEVYESLPSVSRRRAAAHLALLRTLNRPCLAAEIWQEQASPGCPGQGRWTRGLRLPASA